MNANRMLVKRAVRPEGTIIKTKKKKKKVAESKSTSIIDERKEDLA